ncbi:MAG: hypothetical protein ACO3LD_09845 [Luminiphilus sp.]
MATYSVLPASLNLVVLKGDQFGMDVTFSTSLVSYTWESEVFESTKTVNSNYPGGLSTEGDTAATFTVNVVDAAAGELNLELDETTTASLNEATAYRWFLRGVAPGAVTRTYISGSFTVRAP